MKCFGISQDEPDLEFEVDDFVSVVRNYQSLLKLSDEVTNLLRERRLKFDRIARVAQGNVGEAERRVFGLDCYEKEDPNVEIESKETREYLLSASGLRGDGFILVLDGRDVGYALVHPVVSLFNSDCPEEYRKMSERIEDWNGIVGYLNNVFRLESLLTTNDLFHHYDYAVAVSKGDSFSKNREWKEERLKELRGKGYGRLLFRYTMDSVLPKDKISVGFIDSGSLHLDSLVSAMKAGCFIGKEINPSFDGNHPSFLEIYGTQLIPRFTGRAIKYNHKRDNIDVLPGAIRNEFSVSSNCFVAYNGRTNVFEVVDFDLSSGGT